MPDVQTIRVILPVPRIVRISTGLTLNAGTIPATTNLLEGDGLGNASDSGIAASDVVVKASGSTPTTLNEVITLLQSAGLCS
jgi:hypothetical protein